MKNCEIIKWIECFAPKHLALEWDNVGLITGSPEDDVKNIMFCVDLTTEVLEGVIKRGINLVITHHPLYLDGSDMRKVPRYVKNIIEKCEKNHITVYAAHTNLDFTEGGINDALIKKLGVKNTKRDLAGTYVFGDLEEPLALEDYYLWCADKLGTFTNKYCKPDKVLLRDEISRVGVCAGAFDGETSWLTENSIEVLITGELKHHQAILLRELGITAFVFGHFETEYPGIRSLAVHVNAALKEQLNAEHIKISLYDRGNPFCDEDFGEED